MSRSSLLFLFVMLLVLGTAACDSMPVDPEDPASALALMPGGADAAGAAAAPLSLPGLLHAAVDRVYREQGAAAARALVADLRSLHRQAQEAAAAGDREAAAAHLRALREEELRIVLHVFGDAAAARVIDAVTTDAARLRERVEQLAASGHPLPRADTVLTHIDELLAVAGVASQSGDAHGALDAATRAAGLAASLRLRLSEALRLPALEQLFERAVTQLRERTSSAELRSILGRYNELRETARDAVASGRREEAHAALEAVRREQARIVLRVLGPASVENMLQRARTAADELTAALERAQDTGRDVPRLDRMMSAALDMLQRAEAAFARGDAAAALDLGSHAVGLLNTLRTRV